jgi:glycosyltransferase involved in cell wall biosynthesis
VTAPVDRTREAQKRVLALGPLPPFVGGAAKNTAIICNALEMRGAQVTRLPTNKTRTRAEHSRSLGFLSDRTTGFLSNIRRVIMTPKDWDDTTVYLVPDGGFGVAFSAAYARAAVSRFSRLVVHHRSYNHIRRRSRLMALLMNTAPATTVHVFLDPVMEQRFKAVYSADVTSLYVPNAATCDVALLPPETRTATHNTINIGFLSNLVEDKGFDVVAESFPILAERLGPSARFLLAGRPVGDVNAERLAALQQTLGDRLEYFGEVAGVAKTEFFHACDVFVFPTRFAQEAQPNVLYEAMAGGAAIVSTRWAGIPWILEGAVSRIIESGTCCNDLVAAVIDIVSSGDLRTARPRQRAAFLSKKSDADKRYAQLIDVLTGKATY